jgi:uncharacterized protein DUF4395
VAPSFTPVDPRGPRFSQGVVTFALLCGFVAGWPAIAAIAALVTGAGAALGPRYGPLLRLYTDVVEPRLPPTEEREDARRFRVADAVGAVLLAAATIAFAAGVSGVGWAVTLAVAVLAGLGAIAGICLACELDARLSRYVRSPQ